MEENGVSNRVGDGVLEREKMRLGRLTSPNLQAEYAM
jgi:hypothetical protein